MNDEVILSIDPDLAAPMIVRIAPATALFDLDRPVPCDTDTPYVEFYDRRYRHEPGFTPYGQFIVRYCATTLLEAPAGGLILNEAVPQWAVDPRTMAHVLDWLRKQLAPRATPAATAPDSSVAAG